MPAKNFLNSETKEKLQKALKEHEHPDIRERVLIFLLLNDGNTQKRIAELIGCSLSKVAYWCVHGVICINPPKGGISIFIDESY
jgi:DNA-directed RNA polymerase specialized sigma subunit